MIFDSAPRYGITLREMSHIGKARSILVMSLRACPCNWSAWLDLAALCPDRDVLTQLDLPTGLSTPINSGTNFTDHWMYPFFLAHSLLELQHTAESLKIYQELSTKFVNNNYLLAQRAMARYGMQGEFQELSRINYS